MARSGLVISVMLIIAAGPVPGAREDQTPAVKSAPASQEKDFPTVVDPTSTVRCLREAMHDSRGLSALREATAAAEWRHASGVPSPALGSCVPDYSVTAPYVSPISPKRSTCGASDDCDVTGADAEDHVYEVFIPEDGTWVFSLCGSGYNTKIAVGTACCSEDVGYNDDSDECPNSLHSRLQVYLTAGTYFVTVDGDSGACGEYVLDIQLIPPCVVDCPAGGGTESEPCGDETNDGCDMLPDPAQFEPLGCDETVCGTIWADAGERDTDWYEVQVTDDSRLTLSAEAEFPLVIGLVPTRPCGSDACEDVVGTSLDPYALGGECDLISVTTPCLPAGTYWLFVSHQAFSGRPCDGNNDYYVTLTCTECTAVRGACCFEDAPCEILTACQCLGHYLGNGTTCDLCVENDYCDDATPIGEVVDLPFDTTHASFDGSGTCMISPNTWYCYTPTCTGLATISLCGSGYDTKLAAYETCGCDPLGPELGCRDDDCGAQSELVVPVYPGERYLIEVGGHGASKGPGILNIACEPGEGTLAVESTDCQDDAFPDAGYQVVVELWMRNLAHAATGFQAFLAFDEAVLAYRGDLSSYTTTPFQDHITPPTAALVGAGELNLDGSVDAMHPDGTMADSLLATLVFDVEQECDTTTIDFREFEIFVSEISYHGYPLDTNLLSTSFSSDNAPPTVTELEVVGGAVDADCKRRVTFSGTVIDNCCLHLLDVDISLVLLTGNAAIGARSTNKTLLPDGRTVLVEGWADVINLVGCPATLQVTIDSEDCCGNVADPYSATADVVDITPPDISCTDITAPADAGLGCEAEIALFASAMDNCSDIPGSEIEFTIDDDGEPGFTEGDTHLTGVGSPYTFPVGATAVQAAATDACGNRTTCTSTVTIEAVNSTEDIPVVLPGVDAADWPLGPLTRCIKFVARDSGTGECADPVHVEVTFTGSPATGYATLQVPCGMWDELCAKDEQHTLYDTQSLVVVGRHYALADPGGSPLVLLAGDTDNDSDVDISDVTWLMFQWSSLPGGGPAAPGGCPWDGTRDADFDNNNVFTSTDYLLLSANWHEWSLCPCTAAMGASHPGEAPVESIAVTALAAEVGAAVDLNGDGVFNVRDVEQFESNNGLPHSLSAKMKPVNVKVKPSDRPTINRRSLR